MLWCTWATSSSEALCAVCSAYMLPCADSEAANNSRRNSVCSLLPTGKGRETRALPPPAPTQRVTAHPYAAPLHRIRTEEMLPAQLLTPFQVIHNKLWSLPPAL